ncbi:MAG: hypothetical protein Kow0079_08950 [Vicingaceae bacterium]
MKDFDNIEDLFKESFENFEADVDPNLWNNIQAKIGQSSVPNNPSGNASNTLTTAATKTLATKLIVGIAIGGAMVFGGYQILKNNQPKNDVQQQPIADQAPVTNEKIEITGTSEKLDNNEQNTLEKTTEHNEPKTQKINSNPSTNENSSSTNLENTATASSNNGNTNENNVPEEVTVVSETQNINNNTNKQDIKNTSSASTNEIEVENHETATQSVNTNPVSENNETTNNQPVTSSTSSLDVLPNVITPNADGKNDILRITGKNLKEIHAQVYDLKGNLIYKWDEIFGFWDGKTMDEQELPNNSKYILIVTAVGEDGKMYKEKQTVTLFK